MDAKMKEMFRDFDFNEKPEELVRSVGGLELPEDYLDCNIYFAKDRMRRGQLVDFTDSTLEV